MQFIIARDHTNHFVFSPLQTPFAKGLLDENSMAEDLTTVVLLDDAGAHTKSRAIFRMLPYLGFPYTCLAPIGLACPCLLDPMYSFVGRNRSTVSKYWRKVFGHDIESHTGCMLGLEGMTVEKASSSRGAVRG